MSIKIGEIVKGRIQSIQVNDEGLAENVIITLADNITMLVPIGELELIVEEEELIPRRLARKIMGKMIIAKVINTNPIIGSNKQALAEKKMSVNINKGQEIIGKIVAVESDYAKIEYKDCIILTLPSSEYNHLKTVNLRYVLNTGDDIKVKVLSVDADNEEIIVSHKPFSGNTWEELLEKYHIRSQHLGVIVNMIKYGVFVNLEYGIDILCTPYPFFEVKRGDEVAVEITSIDKDAGKIRGIITAKALSA